MIQFVTVPVPLVDGQLAIERGGLAAWSKLRFPGAEPHRAAFVLNEFLVFKQKDDGMRRALVKFGAVSMLEAAGIPGKVDRRDLHAETDPEVGNPIFPCVAGRGNLTLDTPVAEAPRDEDRGDSIKVFRGSVLFNVTGVDPDDIDLGVIGRSRMGEGFVNRLVGVLELNVFADDPDLDRVSRVDNAINHIAPFDEVRLLCFKAEPLTDDAVEVLIVQIKRSPVDRSRDIEKRDDGFGANVAKHRDFLFDVVVDRVLRTTNDNVRGDPDLAQLRDTLLGGLRLQFLRRLDVRNEGGVHKGHVLVTDFILELS